ncbi:hypothetical protein T08_16423 [Trichinella sp. T8]|nr:hypothetical protein T08_16423 [Trichinella sp. T8]
MARRNHSIIWGPNKVSGSLHGKKRLISFKSAVVLFGILLDAVEIGNPQEYMKLNAASTIQKAKNRALAAVVITSYETNDDSDGQSRLTMQH